MPEILDPGALDGAPDRQTRVIGGNGTDTLSYTLPAGLFQFIESVLVQVDATGAGGAVAPELSIATENGVVIATKRQEDDIPAGDTGSATYALRLAGNTSRGAIRYDKANVGDWLDVHTTGQGGDSGGGQHYQADAGEIAFEVTDLTFGALRFTAPFFFFDAQGGIYRFTDSQLFDVTADAVQLSATLFGAFIDGGPQGVSIVGDTVTVELPAAGTFSVLGVGGTPLFTVTA